MSTPLRIPEAFNLWLVPMCTIFIKLIGLHLRKCFATGVAPFCLMSHTSQFLASLGGCQLNTSGPNHGPCSTLVATQVFKCSYGKEGDEHHTLVPRGLAGWIWMAMCTWQVMDTALMKGTNNQLFLVALLFIIIILRCDSGSYAISWLE